MDTKFLEKINILQIIVFAAILAIATGLLPLGDGVSANETLTKLSLVFGVVSVFNPANTRRVVDALAEIKFQSNQINQLFDMLKMFMGSTEPTPMSPVGNTTINVNPAVPIGVGSELPVMGTDSYEPQG